MKKTPMKGRPDLDLTLEQIVRALRNHHKAPKTRDSVIRAALAFAHHSIIEKPGTVASSNRVWSYVVCRSTIKV